MSIFNDESLGFDLDFMIEQTGKELVGVSPATIQDLVFVGSFQSLEEGFEVDLAGREVELDSEIVINGSNYSVLPTKGALLKDRDGNHFKVFEIKREDPGPIYRMQVASRYQGETS